MRSATNTGRRAAATTKERRSGVFLWPLLAAALACAVYINALDNPFVYDDRDTVVANPSIVDPSNLRFILAYSPFRPVVNASYALDFAAWGPSPFGFHLTNVALHALVVVLLYLLVLALLRDTVGSSSPAGGGANSRLAAFAAAAVFAVHPLMTEAVGYISGRSELLCAAWFIAAMLLARRGMIGPARWGIGAAACALLALGSKENAAALPVTLLAYDWLVRPGSDAARYRRLWWLYVPSLLVIAAAAVYRFAVLSPESVGASPLSPGVNALTQAIVLWRYIGLLLWPMGQTIMHGARRVTSLTDPVALIALAGLVALAAIAWRTRRRQPLVTLGAVWFFAALAPSSSVVALREVMAEHRVYLASAGAMIVVAAGARHVLDTRRGTGGRPVAFVAGVTVVVVALSALTLMRNEVWGSPVTLWSEAASAAPSAWEPHYALADALREANQCDQAVPEYERVIVIQPSHRDAYLNMGICLGQSGRLEEAQAAFRRTLEIDPGFARGYTNLGALALVAGDMEGARGYYREAIAQDPGNVLARMQLARLYEQVFKEYGLAAQMCGEARLIAPFTPGVVECMERNQRLAAGKDR